MKYILLFCSLFMFGLPASVQAATDQAAAKATVEKLGSEAISFLEDSSLNDAQKAAKFRTLLQRTFDMQTIGRFALGRYWRTATPAQQKEYLKLFEDMIVRVYSSRFDEYDGQDFIVKSVTDTGKGDALVTSMITPPRGADVQVDWRMREKNGRPHVIDVIIEGVSMGLTQRSDFSSVIQRGGGNIDVLLDHLRK